jgi:hypothetical protein
MTSKRFSFSVLLPTSLAIDAPNLKQKTIKIGSIGHGLAVFRVKEVCIYDDDDLHVKNQAAEAGLTATLLRYMETPQYLRKLLFKRMPELLYAGLLPPLRTPHHPLEDEKNKPGYHREGVVIEANENQSLIEIGLPEKATVGRKLRVGQRLTVRLGKRLGGGRIAVTPVTRDEIDEYWGYEVTLAPSIAAALNRLRADYVIGTSRRGKNLYEAVQAIKDNSPARVAVAFGGPYQGLFEICGRQGVDAGKLFDAMINTIPSQGTATVRTEEALVATLALLNALVEG